MTKLDLRKELRHLYAPSAQAAVRVEVPSMHFLMIDGQGDPNTSRAYAEAVEALFTLSYALKFAVKKGDLGIDYSVMPLEGLWWADDMSSFETGERSGWRWTMMILQPEFISYEMVEQARTRIAKKKVAALPSVRFQMFAEGLAALVMHIGPFSDEGPTIERVHRFIAESGHQLSGKHHEIYLSDIRKADPTRWRTIIRQPMR